jgi:hypothetical protein
MSIIGDICPQISNGSEVLKFGVEEFCGVMYASSLKPEASKFRSVRVPKL